MCGERGRRIQYILDPLFVVFKVVFSKSSPTRRKQLLDNFIVLRVTWTCGNADDYEALEDYGLFEPRMYHASIIALTPYHIMFQEMRVATAAQHGNVTWMDNESVVQVIIFFVRVVYFKPCGVNARG